MPGNPLRDRWRMAVLAALGVLCATGAVVHHERYAQHGHVAVPPAHSTPLAIITAYVAAENDHDHATAAALTDPAMGKAALDHVIGVRLMAQPVVQVAPFGIAYVSVHLLVRGGDQTFGHGPQWWNYDLRHGGASGWEIFGEGTP